MFLAHFSEGRCVETLLLLVDDCSGSCASTCMPELETSLLKGYIVFSDSDMEAYLVFCVARRESMYL